MRVALLVTCVVDVLAPEVGTARLPAATAFHGPVAVEVVLVTNG